MTELIEQLFPQFESELIQEMSELAQVREVRAGEIMMRTGQNIRAKVFVVEGLLKVLREDEHGNEFFMYHLAPGQACALSLVCAMRQETSQLLLKAETDAVILLVPIVKMNKWMATYKSWYQFVIDTYRSRFEELLVTLDHVAFRNMDERLRFYLKKHCETTGKNTIYLTHQEIANELNSSREVISRLMKKLSENGMVKIHRNSVEIIGTL